jgi:hypothetical protein
MKLSGRYGTWTEANLETQKESDSYYSQWWRQNNLVALYKAQSAVDTIVEGALTEHCIFPHGKLSKPAILNL